jgi:biotin synthase
MACLTVGLNPCASLGILDQERAARLKQAGLYRYHHNLETARSFYPRVCTTQDYAKKVQTVKLVKAAGLKSCSGGIFGLGEEWPHRVEMALSLRKLAVDAVPINFLNAVPGTPLAKEAAIPAMEALQIIAIYRFLLPDVEIKVCGGRERILGELQPLMYLAGADGTMVGNYLTTSGRPAAEDEAMVERLGLKIKARENDELGPEGQDAT